MGNTIQPATFTAGILAAPVDPATLATPATGVVALFTDSTNSNKLSTKDSAAVVDTVVTGALDELEVVNNKLQPKAANAAYPLRLGSAAAALTCAHGGFTANQQASYIAHIDNYWQNVAGVNLTTGGTPDASTNSARAADCFDGQTDNLGTVRWQVSSAGGATWLKYTPPVSSVAKSARIYFYPGYHATAYKFQGSNDNFATAPTDLAVITGNGTSGSWITSNFASNTASFTSYRWYFETYFDGNFIIVVEAEITGDPVSGNTIDTPDLISSTLSLAPASLKVYNESAGEITTAGKVNIGYSLDGGTSYISLVDLLTAQSTWTLGALASKTDFRLRLQPVGTQKIGSVYIESISASISLDPSGTITANINGVDVWKTTAAGDETAVTQNCTTLVASGNVGGATGSFGGSTDKTTFEADGTMVMNGAATQWVDANISGLVLEPGGSAPARAQFRNSKAYGYSWAVGSDASGVIEAPHGTKLSAAAYPHLHFMTDATSAAGNVKFVLHTNIMSNNIYLSGNSYSFSCETAVSAAWKEYNVYGFSTIPAGVLGELGEQIVLTVERVSASTSEYAGGAFVLTAGYHMEQDMVGSRQSSTK